MANVSIKFQRRIAELDAQYTVHQPKRQGAFTAFGGLAIVILAIGAIAAFNTYRNKSDDFIRLTLKQAPDSQPQVFAGEPQANRNAVWGATSSGFQSR